MELAYPIEALQAAATYRHERHCLSEGTVWSFMSMLVAIAWSVSCLVSGTHVVAGVVASGVGVWIFVELVLVTCRPTARGMTVLGLCDLGVGAAVLYQYFFPSVLPYRLGEGLGCVSIGYGIILLLHGGLLLLAYRAWAGRLRVPPKEILDAIRSLSREIKAADPGKSSDVIGFRNEDGPGRMWLGADVAVLVSYKRLWMALVPIGHVRYRLNGQTRVLSRHKVKFLMEDGEMDAELGDEAIGRLREWKLPEEQPSA